MPALNAGLVKHSFGFQSVPLGFYEWGRVYFRKIQKVSVVPLELLVCRTLGSFQGVQCSHFKPSCPGCELYDLSVHFLSLLLFWIKSKYSGYKEMATFSSFRWDGGNLHHRFITYLLVTYRTSTLSVATTRTSAIRCFIKKFIQLTDLKAKVQVWWHHMFSLWWGKSHPKWWWWWSMGWSPGVLGSSVG